MFLIHFLVFMSLCFSFTVRLLDIFLDFRLSITFHLLLGMKDFEAWMADWKDVITSLFRVHVALFLLSTVRLDNE